MPPILCITGTSGSGKTQLIERLIPLLTRHGLRVGTIKHDVHGAEPDREGKDTWRHARAGSRMVVLGSPRCVVTRTDVAHEPSLAELATPFEGRVDLVLAEGFSRSRQAKVEVYPAGGTDQPGLPPPLPTPGGGGLGGGQAPRAREGLIATVRARHPSLDVPDFDGEADLEALALLIVAWHSDATRCAAQPASEGAETGPAERVQLLIDGRPLPLKPFLERMLSGIVRGFLGSLRFTGEQRTIEVRIERGEAGD